MKIFREVERLIADMGGTDIEHRANGTSHWVFSFSIKGCRIEVGVSGSARFDEKCQLNIIRQRIRRAMRSNHREAA